MEKLDITPLKYENDKLMILDQTRLPGEEVYEEMSTAEKCFVTNRTAAPRL